MRHHTLQTKLFFYYVGLVVLLLLAFSIFFYRYVSKQLVARGVDSLTTLNASFQNQIDSVIHDMDNVSININYSNLVKDKLDSSFNLDISRNNLKSMAELFVTINGADTKVDQINLYDLSGNVLQVGKKTNTKKIDLSTIPWLEEVNLLSGKKLISNSYRSSRLEASSNYSDWYVSLYRNFNNQLGKTIGAVETIKQCKKIFKSVENYYKTVTNPARVYIYSKDNSLIYPYELTHKEKKQLPDYISEKPENGKFTKIINPNTKEAEYLSYSYSSYSDWTYITVQSEADILKPVNRLLNILMLFVCILLAVSLIVSYYLSRTLIKPIKHLKHIFQRMEIQTLGSEKATNYPIPYVELHELYLAFEKMSEKLKVSMNELIDSRQQELKSRTLALQAQVNPHFYYNTLYSIIVLAENEQSKEVATVCRNLSKIMRYVTDTSFTNVTVQSEIDYVNKYLYCMKVRYQSSLNYIIDIDDTLLQLEVPKLIIQPLVENAIKYGTTCAPPWTISIVGRIYESHWQVDVIDSGSGFSEEAIHAITDRIQEVNEHPGMPEMKINGLGIVNVYLRWKIFSQDSMIFDYGNTVDGHGIVSIGQKIVSDREEVSKA